jgi:hypothetical protein
MRECEERTGEKMENNYSNSKKLLSVWLRIRP